MAHLFSHVQRLEARVALAATDWHTGCTARQGRKAPQEEDLASIDTFLRIYLTGTKVRNAGTAQSRDACRTRAHKGPAPVSSVLGVTSQSGHPSSARSPPDPLGRMRAPRGSHVPEPRQKAWPSHLHLSVDGSTLWGATVWPPGKRFYDLARQSNRSAVVHRKGAMSALVIVKRV